MTDPGQTLPTENKAASSIDGVISDGANAGANALEKAAETSQPWLSLPVVKQIFEGLLSWVIGIVSRAGQLIITFGVTRTQGTLENQALLDAEKEVEAAIQTGDSNAIAKAESDFQKAQSAAANSDGSAPPK